MSRIFLSSLLLGLLAGCGQARSDRPATYPVTGTVRHAGAPVEGATVNFQLVDGSRSAIGITGADGTYALTTFTADDGALPGEYRVSVMKLESPPPPTAVSDDDENYVPPEMRKEPPPQPPKNLLPKKYADVQTSGLTAVVEEGGENRFDLDLE